MGKGTERARANDKPPELTGTIEILNELLEIEKERLKTAVRIEKERGIVFPETTVIIHDIHKYTIEIERRTSGDESMQDEDDCEDLL